MRDHRRRNLSGDFYICKGLYMSMCSTVVLYLNIRTVVLVTKCEGDGGTDRITAVTNNNLY